MQLRREERCKYTENRNNSVTTLPNHLVQKSASYDYFRITFVLNLVTTRLISEAIRACPSIYRLHFEFPNS